MGSRPPIQLVLVVVLAALTVAVGGDREALAREAASDARSAALLPPPPRWLVTLGNRTARNVKQLPRAPQAVTIRAPRLTVSGWSLSTARRLYWIATERPRGLQQVCLHIALREAADKLSRRDWNALVDAAIAQIPGAAFVPGIYDLVSRLWRGEREALAEAWCL
jgi:hypothetical protein